MSIIPKKKPAGAVFHTPISVNIGDYSNQIVITNPEFMLGEEPSKKKSLTDKPLKLTEPEVIVEKCKKEISKEEDKHGHITIENNYINDAIIASAKILNIEVLESRRIKVGTVIVMNAGGLIDSKRAVKDGKAYFGTYAGNDPDKINDYVVSSEEKGFGSRHFMIEYNFDREAYYINDLKDGTGTFIRIVSKIIVDANMIISFGNMHIGLIIKAPQNIPDFTEDSYYYR